MMMSKFKKKQQKNKKNKKRKQKKQKKKTKKRKKLAIRKSDEMRAIQDALPPQTKEE